MRELEAAGYGPDAYLRIITRHITKIGWAVQGVRVTSSGRRGLAASGCGTLSPSISTSDSRWFQQVLTATPAPLALLNSPRRCKLAAPRPGTRYRPTFSDSETPRVGRMFSTPLLG